MSGDSEKPFEATPQRIVKAKREGNVARSSELGANCSFAAGALVLVAVAPLLGLVATGAIAAAAQGAACAASALIVGVALAPVGAAAFAGVLGNILQSGGLVALAIAPKLERLNPFEGVKRIFSRETLAHSARSTLAFGCAAAAMAPCMGWCAVVSLRSVTLSEIAAAAWTASREVAFAALAVGFVFAVAEYGAARNLWLRKLRMSFEERKREAKEEEGDAVARGRRRTLHRALLRSGMSRVKEAAFVVVNPEHLAVALEYRPPKIPVPRVLVRADDAAALRVREIAAKHAIPLVENARLARSLYRECRTGEAILEVHYVAVAEIVVALLRTGAIAR
jgi:flagellar biosynthesis protein FlhB